MPYETNLDLSKFTSERYIKEDEKTRRSYIEAIFRRFCVPNITLEGLEVEWRNKSYSFNDALLLTRFFDRNPQFGPQTNLAQLLQIFCCQRILIDYNKRPTPEYASCRKTTETKFNNLSNYLSIVTFGKGNTTPTIELRNLWVGDLDISADKRPSLRSPKRDKNLDTLVEQIRQKYPSATGPFRQI